MSRADKQYKMALIYILVLAIFSGGYYMFMKYTKEKVDTENKEDKKVINVFSNKKNSINQIDIIAANYRLVLQKKDNKYELQNNKDADLDPVVINNLVDTLNSFNASKLIGENVKSLTDFGLAVPKFSIEYKLVDGTGKTVEIGDPLPMDRGYYIKVKGDNKVYKVEKNIVDYLILDGQKIRDKKVIVYAKDDITMFSLSRKSKVAYEAVREDVKNVGWTIKKPYQFKADDARINDILNMVLGFTVKEFIDIEKNNLDDYGLETPANSIKISTKDGKSVKVFLGMVKEGVGRYIMKEGSKEVFLIEQTEAGFTGYEFKDVANKVLDATLPTDTASLELFVGNEKTLVKIDPGKKTDISDDTIFVNNVQLKEKEAYNSFVGTFNSTTASNVEPNAKPNGKQANKTPLIITAKIKDNKVKTSFVKKSDKEYYVLKNEKYVGYIISDTDFNKIKEAINKLKVAK